MSYNTKIISVLLVALFAAAGSLLADPAARVGRVNYLSGDVSFHPSSVDEWTDAALNYPIGVGDELWTGDGARAELHVGSTAVRLDSDTSLSFLSLDDTVAQMSVARGSLNVRLRRLDAGDTWEIDTPGTSVMLKEAGSYRVDVDPSGATGVTVRSGQAEVSSGQYAYPLYAGQSARITADTSGGIAIGEAASVDDWDTWCAARDAHEDSVASVRYVPRAMTGYEDLDAYGTWSVDADYGEVWAPAGVPAGWAPYRDGHWAWIAPWGWTWIDRAPWGFAPFHYGRWARIRGAWMWAPGPRTTVVVYAPALVVFVGAGPTEGNVGWFPLGPRDPYIPPYTATIAYRQRINVGRTGAFDFGRITVADVHYMYRDDVEAHTLVPRLAFARSEQVRDVRIVAGRVPPAQIRVSAAPAGVVAQRESLLAAPIRVPAAAARVPAQLYQRPVVVRTTPERRPPAVVPGAGPQPRQPQVRTAPQGPGRETTNGPQPQNKTVKKRVYRDGQWVWIEVAE